MNFLVVDFGTSSCRAGLVGPDGDVRILARRNVEIRTRPGGAAELDPEYVWDTVVSVLRDFTASSSGKPLDALGISSLLGYVFLSQKLEPLYPAMIYMDTRARGEAEALARSISPRDAYRITGRRMSPELLAPKLLWLKTNRSESYGKIRHILGLKDEILRRLTGNLVTDWAHMNYTWLFDVVTGSPDEGLCAAVGITPGVFPEAGSAARIAGRVGRNAAALTGLPEGLPVAVGSIDGTTAMYGAGMAEPETAALVSGTTDVLMTLTPEPVFEASLTLNLNTGMPGDSFALGGATGHSGGAVKRFMELLRADPESLFRDLSAVDPRSFSDLFVFPGFTGERAPYWTERAAGGMVGLSLAHEPVHILSAVLESCSFRIAKLVEVLNRSGIRPAGLRIAGGAALPGWNRIRADVIGLPIEELKEKEATTLGTAMFCLAALEPGEDLRSSARKWIKVDGIVEPLPERREEYAKKRKKFEELLETLYR